MHTMPQKEDKATQGTEAIVEQEFFSAVIAGQQEENKASPQPKQEKEPWLTGNFEGQLSVDVYQTEDSVVIQSTVAGVRVEDLDISVNNDMVTIRGIRRRDEEVKPENYFYQECYWGGFSRSIILPFDVKTEKVSATLKNGILTVILPKAEKPRVKNVRVREEIDDAEA